MSGVSKVTGDSPSIARFWQHSIGDHVIVLAWSPGGDMVAAGAIDGSVTVFDAEDGKIRHVVRALTFGLTTLAWRPGTSEFATGGHDGNIRLWNAVTGSELGRLEAGDSWVERVAWQADGKVLATAAGRSLRLWDNAGRPLRSHSDHPSTIADIKWIPGKDEVSAAVYGGLICWRPDQDKPVRKFEYKGSVLAIAFSPDGRFIAAGNQDSTVHLWSTETGKDLCMSGYSTKVRELSWDANSRFLATGGGPSVAVWDFSGKGPAGSKPVSLERDEKFLTQLVYQNSGEILASGSEDGSLALWYPAARKPLLTSLRLRAPVAQLAWSPDDRVLAVGGADGLVSILRVF